MKGYLDALEDALRGVRRSATLDRLRIVWTASREWPEGLAHVASDLLSVVFEYHGTAVRLAHGDARGGDQLAKAFGWSHRWQVMPYPVSRREWQTYGGHAGHRRNALMLAKERPDLVIGLVHHGSAGASGCTANALSQGIPVVRVDEELALLPRTRATL